MVRKTSVPDVVLSVQLVAGAVLPVTSALAEPGSTGTHAPSGVGGAESGMVKVGVEDREDVVEIEDVTENEEFSQILDTGEWVYGVDFTGDPNDPFSWVAYGKEDIEDSLTLIGTVTRTHAFTEVRTSTILAPGGQSAAAAARSVQDAPARVASAAEAHPGFTG